MPTFNRAAAKAAGYSDADIDAHLQMYPNGPPGYAEKQQAQQTAAELDRIQLERAHIALSEDKKTASRPTPEPTPSASQKARAAATQEALASLQKTIGANSDATPHDVAQQWYKTAAPVYRARGADFSQVKKATDYYKPPPAPQVPKATSPWQKVWEWGSSKISPKPQSTNKQSGGLTLPNIG